MTGLRAQLALAIALVTAVAVGASFLALYSGTGSRLRSLIDAQLRTQAAEWHLFAPPADRSTPAALETAAQRFIASQRYHAESLINVVQVNGGRRSATTPRCSLAKRRAHRAVADGRPARLPRACRPRSVAEAGSMRVLALPINYDTRRVGTFRVANSLAPVAQAQSSLRRTFVIVGIVAVVLAAVAGVGLAALIAAPLRRITAVAAAATAGDLSKRAGPVSASGEVGVLAAAFDDMLERLERAFKRQRDFVSDASHELRTPLSVAARTG